MQHDQPPFDLSRLFITGHASRRRHPGFYHFCPWIVGSMELARTALSSSSLLMTYPCVDYADKYIAENMKAFQSNY
jgi:hypothetical protein